MSLSICAVIGVRNEASYLRVLLPILASQKIDVVIIDNESTDRSHELYTIFSGNPIISIEHLPYKGFYAHGEQLEIKQEIYRKIDHDWVIHHDADEILEHYKEGHTLRDAIEEADEAGYNILNFDEIVFLPESHEDFRNKNYYQDILHYYFFEPCKQRLHRVWKRALNFDSTKSGGHTITDKRAIIYPQNHILRHYIVTGYEHAKEKYLKRVFCKQDLANGWHGNRKNFTQDNLKLPADTSYLGKLSHYSSKEIYTGNPMKRHYWEWE